MHVLFAGNTVSDRHRMYGAFDKVEVLIEGKARCQCWRTRVTGSPATFNIREISNAR